jgi:hypothetical protein
LCAADVSCTASAPRIFDCCASAVRNPCSCVRCSALTNGARRRRRSRACRTSGRGCSARFPFRRGRTGAARGLPSSRPSFVWRPGHCRRSRRGRAARCTQMQRRSWSCAFPPSSGPALSAAGALSRRERRRLSASGG